MKPYKYLVLLCGMAAVFYTACRKEEIVDTKYPQLPENPYDTIDRSQGGGQQYKIDSASIIGVHEYVFSKKCAQPACHDGSFEPDFRTVESAYSTLVYHPVVKNDASNSFQYRVVPYDPEKSWLHHRITTTDQILGRMPLYDTLAPWQIALVKQWISEGAKDIFGNTPGLPNPQPSTYGLVAFLPDMGGVQIDTNRRPRFYDPFIVPKNTNVEIWFGIYDDKTNPLNFKVNEAKFSLSLNDYSKAVTKKIQATATPKMAKGIDRKVYPFFLSTTINTALYQPGDIVYMRVYVQDEDHTKPTEIPSAGSQYPLFTYFSFIVGN